MFITHASFLFVYECGGSEGSSDVVPEWKSTFILTVCCLDLPYLHKQLRYEFLNLAFCWRFCNWLLWVVSLSISFSVCLSRFLCMSVSVFVSLCLFVCLCLCVCLSICLSICLPLSLKRSCVLLWRQSNLFGSWFIDDDSLTSHYGGCVRVWFSWFL